MQDGRPTPKRNLLLIVASISTVFGLHLAFAADPPSAATIPAPPLFDKWPQDKKPDMVLLLSGQQYSYLKFCGCSSPQYGGFERRYNLIQFMKAKGWPVVPLDLGDLVERRSYTIQEQELIKYTTSMEALHALGYPAVALGQNEFNLPLIEGLSRYTLQKPGVNPQVVCANMSNKNDLFPHPNKPNASMIEDLVIVPGENGAPAVGAAAAVSPSVREQIQDPSVQFFKGNETTQKVFPEILKQFDAQKVELRVLLYQGTPKDAVAAANAFPQFPVVLCRCPTEDPPGMPTVVGKSIVVEVGQRARHVGVVGAYRNGNGFDFQYQLVKLGPEFETVPDRVKDHPVLQVLQNYSQQVKDANLIVKYPKVQHPLQAKYPQQNVKFEGNDTCAKCHQSEMAKWKRSGHSHAFATLETKAVKPTLRQYDGECVRCHVVGFDFVSGFVDETKTAHFKNVGCESCHGPGSLHAAQPNNTAFRDDMMPWRTPGSKEKLYEKGEYIEKVMLAADKYCQKCHDELNDPHFKFEKYWPKIDHSRHGAVPKPKP